MTNKLNNNHFEYKGKDELKSLTIITDYDRQYKCGLPSPQEVVEDLIQKTKEDISTLEMIYDFKGDFGTIMHEREKTVLMKQLTHLLYVYEDINKGELEYDIAREGSE